jgi:pre-mRNA-processing factor 40
MPESQAAPSAPAPPAAASKSLWTEYTHQDGRKYYYHAVTKQTVWQKPDELKTPKEVPWRQ